MRLSPLTWYLLIHLLVPQGETKLQTNRHHPQKVTWAVVNAGNGEILNSTSRVTVPDIWCPELYFNLCDLVRGSWDVGDWTHVHEGWPECGGARGCTLPLAGDPNSPGCSHVLKRAALRDTPFYVCPGSNRTVKEVTECGGASDYYCAQWGCEQTRTGYWIRQKVQ